MLFNFDHIRFSQVGTYHSDSGAAHLRPELRAAAFDDSIRARDLTMDEIVKQAEESAWGPPKQVAERIIAEAEKLGAGTILVSMNRGAMPQDMFLNQTRRFGTEVLPLLQRHSIVRVPSPSAEAVG